MQQAFPSQGGGQDASPGPAGAAAAPSPATDAALAAGLLASFEAGGEASAAAMEVLLQPGVFGRLSFEPVGCRAVQLALDAADRHQAVELAAKLRGRVVESVRSPHANYVLQKVIKVLAPQEVPFIVDELAASGLDLARHEYGCRIFCRLLEHSASSPAVAALLDAELASAESDGELLRHTFGHHVVECALEHGLPRQRQAVVAIARKNLMGNAWNRNAAYVVEKALLYGTAEERAALTTDFAACSSSDLAALARSQFGSMVMRALLRQPQPCAATQRIQDVLKHPAMIAHLRGTKHGRRLLEERSLGLMRRFAARGSQQRPAGMWWG